MQTTPTNADGRRYARGRRAHCHRIIKLSGTLGQFAPEKELIENVHGIRASFLDAGKEVSKRIDDSPGKDPIIGSEADPSVYFIGKMLWSKGIGSLMELLQYADENAGIKIKIDMYGGGPDKDAAEKRADSPAAKTCRNIVLILAAAAICVAIPMAAPALMAIHAVAVKVAISSVIGVLAVGGSALAIKELKSKPKSELNSTSTAPGLDS